MPKLKELAAQHEGQLVLIGVHTTNGGEKMSTFVGDEGIQYPVAIDVDGKTVASFSVDSFPDYYLIDRAGKLRFADLANAELDRAVEMLLAEEAPQAGPLDKAMETAAFKDKRVLVAWDGLDVRGLASGNGELGKLLRNEFELVSLARADHVELARRSGGADLAAFAADGSFLASRSKAGLDAASLATFLETHRVPQKDAAQLWADALAQAQREQKRVLVHLGAPW